MKKKILKIGALVLAIVLIIGVCLFANALIGNPISKALAKKTAEKHIQQVYGDRDYELNEVTYSFKDGYYHATVSSPASMDTYFTLSINSFGKLRYDNYEYQVTNGWNTAHRLGDEYRKIVETVINSSSFPYHHSLGYGELVFVSREDKELIPEVADYALITNELKTDAYYNVNELGAQSGKLTLYIDERTVSAERLAEILLGIRECFDEAGVGFYAIDCVLEYTQNEDAEYQYGRVEVMELLYADIYEEGMVERVKASNDAANAYYAAQDAEKLGEIEEGIE